ncbi:hypothetical protein FHA39_11580 [Escherichia coli]|nr:hypothetical protein [Escherichia coli]MBW9515729.1 hypothetical protein [Escherichia coli]
MASVSISCPSCSATDGVVRNWHGWDGSRCRFQNRWSCMTKSSGII